MPGHEGLMDKASAPLQTSKHTMCASPFLSAFVIATSYGIGRGAPFALSDPLAAGVVVLTVPPATAALVSLFSEYVITRDHPHDHKMAVIQSQMVLATVAAFAGNVIG